MMYRDVCHLFYLSETGRTGETMKIDFTKVLPESATEKNKVSYVTAKEKSDDNTQIAKAGYSLDISGIVKDNSVCEGHGKTGEDVCTGMSRQDMTNARNYMTVMSNSLSAEDFGKLMENGEEPSYEEAGTTTTILDAVKVALIKSGKSVEGFTTDIDKKVVEELTGSEAYANELTESFAKYDVPVTKENVTDVLSTADTAHEISPLSDGAMKYLVENDIEPTIKNLYESQYCASGDGTQQAKGYYASGTDGYYVAKAEDPDFERLKPQIDKVIADSGLENSDETQNECRWIVSRGIPLTTDSLTLFNDIKNIELPASDKDIFDAAVSARSDGMRAQDGTLSDTRNMLEKSLDMIEQIDSITDDSVAKAVSEDKIITVKSLMASQKEIDVYLAENPGSDTSQDGVLQDEVSDTGMSQDETMISDVSQSESYNSEKILNAEKTLASVRLNMTVKANLILLESGYSIDTAPLEKLAKDLENAGRQADVNIFGEGSTSELEAKSTIYENTLKVSSSISDMPAALLGDYSVNDTSFTLQNTYDSGLNIQQKMAMAEQTYETVGTAPRSDLGDSITKAFANTDDLLAELGMDNSSDNERAVRILGYNRMEVTKENVERVAAADATLRNVIGKMTPSTVLDTVRKGVNPLNMNVSDLEDYLNGSDENEAASETQFGRFIYNLEKNGKITEDERTSCVGIYRLFRQIEKGEDASVGAVLDTGADMTFENLLTAVRTSKKGSMDYTVDDQFAGIDSIRKNESISDQIKAAFAGENSSAEENDEDGHGTYEGSENNRQRYYRSAVSDVLSDMTPQKVIDAAPTPDMSLDEFIDKMRETKTDILDDSDYIAERMQDIQDQEISDLSADEMFTYALPVTIDNIAGLEKLRHSRGSWYRDIEGHTENEAGSDEDTAASDEDEADDIDIIGSMTDRQSTESAVKKLTDVLDNRISDASLGLDVGYMDLKLLKSCRTQLGIIRKLSSDENYEIPVMIDGEQTSIHLKMIHDSEDGGRVSITMSTAQTGQTAAELKVSGESVSGYIACSDKDTASYVESHTGDMIGSLTGRIDVIGNGDVDLDRFEIESDKEYRKSLDQSDMVSGKTNERTDTAALYKIASSFIRMMISSEK